MALIGTGLALGLIVVYVLMLRIILRAPFKALGVLVAGMAFHNIVLMSLLDLGTPALLVRTVQFWKEGILLLLVVLAARRFWASRADWLGNGRRVIFSRLNLLDIVAFAFAGLTCIYLLLPDSLMRLEGNLAQRVVSFRIDLLLPLLYAFGRIFWSTRREDLVWVAKVLLGSAAVVAIFGLWELWFVPTSDWLDWGVNLFSQWLGYTYHGPRGMPENFYQSTESGLALRRMVSTYISPLGLAYMGLLLVPIGMILLEYRRKDSGLPSWFRWGAFSLLIISMLFSVTRGALFSLVAEVVLIVVLLRQWRPLATAAVVIIGVVFILFEYGQFGPLVTFDLVNVRLPAGYALVRNVESLVGLQPADMENKGDTSGATPAPTSKSGELVERTLSLEDPSASGHMAALKAGTQYAKDHPLGTGLGSAVPRYGTTSGPGESALLLVVGELGALGGLLYVAMYLLALLYGAIGYWKSRGDLLVAAYPLIAFVGGLALLPIMITSAIWGNFSLTFLFWWCTGLSVTVAQTYLRKNVLSSSATLRQENVTRKA